MDEEIVSDEEMATRIRKLVLDVIELWSSKEAQLNYQKNVPIANVSAELFEQWTDFYNPDDRKFKMAFNETELKLLADFEHVLERETTRVSPYNVPDIELFVYTLEWREINNAAIELLNKIKN
ncbi:hypothetical protein [Pontibacter sp. HSC-36F09]|uniref:Uncharacterized protein n=2 Tax=Pontibacter virosus TaxID=1765052 RepID=A0A2U1AI47_9BACT|nr:hypothetical protein [Pontibacter sp. HSC-36F09]MCP2045056.1 hypothetical protein [Pontibacter sp. HSC-36F09]PVY36079.1 hypothetical protein C8E01_1284 [Pontibacter virosus]